MNKFLLALTWLFVFGCQGAAAMQMPASKSALGTSAAVDPNGQLWIAYAEGDPSAATVYVSRSKDMNSWDKPIRVNATPEPVSSDGENRPKLAFDKQGGLYVTWTSPTSANYTGDIRFAGSSRRTFSFARVKGWSTCSS